MIWHGPKDRYPDGAPLGASMLEYGRISHWTPSLYHGDAINRDYVMMLGYETTTAEISDDYAEDPDAADALYKGKTRSISGMAGSPSCRRRATPNI